jgi:pyruvate/2-oxoglutarate dehydrogenase complex dihydrolipoamide dehydrogenase (E3) component
VRQVSADQVIINTGTRPALPPLPGLAGVRPLDSESIQELGRLPEYLIILVGLSRGYQA